jgi:hypothetical protein
MNTTTQPSRYVIVYHWHGERLRSLLPCRTMQEAKAVLWEFMKDGWYARIEVVGGGQ